MEKVKNKSYSIFILCSKTITVISGLYKSIIIFEKAYMHSLSSNTYTFINMLKYDCRRQTSQTSQTSQTRQPRQIRQIRQPSQISQPSQIRQPSQYSRMKIKRTFTVSYNLEDLK